MPKKTKGRKHNQRSLTKMEITPPRASHSSKKAGKQSKDWLGKLKMRDDIADKIAKGATGVAITAGVIAASAVLAKRKNREAIAKGAQKGLRVIKNAAATIREELPEYPPIAHNIGRGRKTGKGRSRGKKKR